MTDEKVLWVLALYEARLSVVDTVVLHNPQSIGKLTDMIPKIRGFIAEGNRRDKVFRWLGFMQGVLWTEGFYSLDDLKEHNRPAPAPGRACLRWRDTGAILCGRHCSGSISIDHYMAPGQPQEHIKGLRRDGLLCKDCEDLYNE